MTNEYTPKQRFTPGFREMIAYYDGIEELRISQELEQDITYPEEKPIPAGHIVMVMADQTVRDGGLASDFFYALYHKKNGATDKWVNSEEEWLTAIKMLTRHGKSNGLAELDEAGTVPASQLPSYVDDVIEGYAYPVGDPPDYTPGAFYKDAAHTQKITGETGKIYTDLGSHKKIYRWTGSQYILISRATDVLDDSIVKDGPDSIDFTWTVQKLMTAFKSYNPEFFESISMGRTANTIKGSNSTAIGNNVTATGANSVAEGTGTVAAGNNQHVSGKYNVSDSTSLEIVGKGTDDSHRANARTLDANGNEWLAGSLQTADNIIADDNLSVGGTASITGKVTASDDVDISKKLTVTGTTTLTGKLTANGGAEITGDESVSGNSTVGGNETITGNLSVSGTETLTGKLTASDDVDISKNLAVTGTSTLTGQLTANSGAAFTGSVTMSRKPQTDAEVATKQYVDDEYTNRKALLYKGTVGAAADNPDFTDLPSQHSVGWTYKVLTPGLYADKLCELYDCVICVDTQGTDDDWLVLQSRYIAITTPSISIKAVTSAPSGSSTNSGLVEIDAKVTAARLDYSINRVAKGMKLNSYTFSPTPSGTSGSITDNTILGIPAAGITDNADKTWTFYVTDERKIRNSVWESSSAILRFRSKVKYGVAKIPTSINDAFLNGLSVRTLTNNSLIDIARINCSGSDGDYYLWYAVPHTYAPNGINFKDYDTEFVGGFQKVETFNHKNESTLANGKTTEVSYDVYRSTNPNIGSVRFTVTKK